MGHVHSDRGPYLICCWYRSRNLRNVDTIKQIVVEYRKPKDDANGVFMFGDLNVHIIRWLTHSARVNVWKVDCRATRQTG